MNEKEPEIIEFPGKTRPNSKKLGGKIPKGVLLFGSPAPAKPFFGQGRGGEAGVPFFPVRVGLRGDVRGWRQPRAGSVRTGGKTPRLLFVDEIDAVGRQRFAGIGGGHDEREQTLNQLLVEMDGFDTKEGVILIAATNRPTCWIRRSCALDVSTASGGSVPGPLKAGNRSSKSTPRASSSAAMWTSRSSPGGPGVRGRGPANLVNEGALWLPGAAKSRRHERVGGLSTASSPARNAKAAMMSERRSWSSPTTSRATPWSPTSSRPAILHKVSIIPAGRPWGYTPSVPTEDRYLTSKSDMIHWLCILLGGRTAEEIVFNEITTGRRTICQGDTDRPQDGLRVRHEREIGP